MTKEELCRLEQSVLVKLIDEGKLIYLPEDYIYSYSTDTHNHHAIVKGDSHKTFLQFQGIIINTMSCLVPECKKSKYKLFNKIWICKYFIKVLIESIFFGTTKKEMKK